MSRLPEEPNRKRLRDVRAVEVVRPKGSKLWRIYFRGGKYPTTWDAMRYFGPTARSRFDHHTRPPQLQKRGVMYLAENGVTCFAECFQAGSACTIDIGRGEPWLVGFELARSVKLHNLRTDWPTQAGTSEEIHSGRMKRFTQNWSRAIYEEYGKEIEGLYYKSSMYGGRPVIALYERGKTAIPKDPKFHHALDDPDIFNLVKNAAGKLKWTVVNGKDVIWTPCP